MQQLRHSGDSYETDVLNDIPFHLSNKQQLQGTGDEQRLFYEESYLSDYLRPGLSQKTSSIALFQEEQKNSKCSDYVSHKFPRHLPLSSRLKALLKSMLNTV